MDYPESVLTRNKKGETEVRRLLEKGVFVKYDYIYPGTGKRAEKGKLSIILKTPGGEEHYFLIPLKGEKFLAIKPKEEKPNRKFWDPGKGKAVGIE